MTIAINAKPREKPDPRTPTNAPGEIAPGAIIAASGGLVLRYARDDDAAAIIALITAVWSEYPGKILVAETDMPELLQPATSYAECDGRFWIIEGKGRIIGAVALAPSEEPGVVELQKLYVARDMRQNGLGSFLCYLVDREARTRGAHAVELWSDIKLHDAHRRYERVGYRRGAEIRKRDDTSKTVQYYYRKPIAADQARLAAGADELPNWWQMLAALQTAGERIAEAPAA